MLPERYVQLLTAYVDGELGTRQRKTVLRLLRKSSTARTLFEKLQSDSQRVRDLTRLKLGADFPQKVMRTIALQPARRPARPATPAMSAASPWLGWAIAASILLLICVGSYLYYSPRQGARVEGPFAIAEGGVHGALGQFGPTALRLAAADLRNKAMKTRLATELRRDNAFHVDFAVRDNGRAVQHLTKALNQQGIKVLVAGGARQRLQQKAPKASYVVYAENVRPDELGSILGQMTVAAQGPVAGSLDIAVEQVIVDALTGGQRQQLSNLLGLPASKLAPAKMGPGDPPADLLNKTLIARDPAGQGTPAVPPKTLGPLLRDRLAVVLAVTAEAAGNPADLPEVRTFVSNRREQRPGTLQVLMVVHEASV
jgi:anti-sigma factor RsiW